MSEFEDDFNEMAPCVDCGDLFEDIELSEDMICKDCEEERFIEEKNLEAERRAYRRQAL